MIPFCMYRWQQHYTNLHVLPANTHTQNDSKFRQFRETTNLAMLLVNLLSDSHAFHVHEFGVASGPLEAGCTARSRNTTAATITAWRQPDPTITITITIHTAVAHSHKTTVVLSCITANWAVDVASLGQGSWIANKTLIKQKTHNEQKTFRCVCVG
jgi:hypothetical protein